MAAATNSSAEQVAEALQFVLQHQGTDTIDQQTLCALLQTNSVIRRALQACRSQCAITLELNERDACRVQYTNTTPSSTSTDINPFLFSSADTIVVAPLTRAEEGAKVPTSGQPTNIGPYGLVWFARWLRRHAGLVGSLEVRMPHVYNKPGVLIKLQLALAKLLQDCASSPSAPPPAPASGVTTRRRAAAQAAPVLGALVGLPLQLQSFTLVSEIMFKRDCVPVVSRLLKALAAAKLQELDVDELLVVTPGFSSGLRSLQSLRSLRLLGLGITDLSFDDDNNTNPFHDSGVLAAVGSLRHLTSLHLGPTLTMLQPPDAQLLPASLAALEVAFIKGSGGEDRVDLSHLTALSRLRWASAERYLAGVKSLEVVLPANLNTLIAGSPLPRVQGAQAKLHQLKAQLVWDDDCDVLASILPLTKPAELFVALHQSFEGNTRFSMLKLTKAAVERAAAAVGSCTSLVSFELDLDEVLDEDDDSDDSDEDDESSIPSVGYVRWCPSLAKLPTLERVVVTGQGKRLPMQSADIMQLTALTSLTSLELVCGYNSGLGAAAVPLVQHLTGLRHLCLDCVSINSRALLPAVAQRTGLRSLCMGGGFGRVVMDTQLSVLSVLTQLTHLTLVEHECTAAGQARLFAAVPGLSSMERYQQDTPSVDFE